MTDLVTLDAFKLELGVTVDTEDTRLGNRLDMVEAALEAACGRRELPFQAAQTARVEVHDGTGTVRLFLDYPIAAITTVLLGRDTSNPAETLDATDVDVLVFAVGGREITRTGVATFSRLTGRRRLFGQGGGATWGGYRDPRYVHVTYNTQADVPEVGGAAVMQVALALERQRGVEGSRQIRVLDSSTQLKQAIADTPEWELAVLELARYAVV